VTRPQQTLIYMVGCHPPALASPTVVQYIRTASSEQRPGELSVQHSCGCVEVLSHTEGSFSEDYVPYFYGIKGRQAQEQRPGELTLCSTLAAGLVPLTEETANLRRIPCIRHGKLVHHQSGFMLCVRTVLVLCQTVCSWPVCIERQVSLFSSVIHAHSEHQPLYRKGHTDWHVHSTSVLLTTRGNRKGSMNRERTRHMSHLPHHKAHTCPSVCSITWYTAIAA
jgi:hypothetical protein